MKASEIRQSFIDFFINHDHKHLPSSPTIPFDDPTIMFVNAGMVQFKDIFTGQKSPDYPRATTSQKCMRAGGKHNDLENVGRTGRHQTFFEMLGNFSFGDYFKEKAISYAWKWVTEHLELPKDKLYASVYEEDDDAFALWEKIAPELKNGRIIRFGKEDNFWSMGNVGPCGPSSEIHFDRGEEWGTGPNDVVNGETERFVEIWNLVFMQYEQKPDGKIIPLPKPSVDTGAGLERIACIMGGYESNYETDLFVPIIEAISEICGKKYHTDERGVSHRVVADHVRALTFCIADGGGLSNEKQGYVLRRILRRAARHGRLMDMREPFIYKIVPVVTDMMGAIYPEIVERKEHIVNVIKAEEESFGRTLDTGIEHFEDVVSKMSKTSGTTIDGTDVFKLYDTYGFPVDLVNIMAEEKGFRLDMDGFDKAMAGQKEKSRGAIHFDEGEQIFFMNSVKNHFSRVSAKNLKTEFIGNKNSVEAFLIDDTISIRKSYVSYIGIVTNKSPFYVESGGQINDKGYIEFDNEKLEISYALKFENVIVHICKIKGELKLKSGKVVSIFIDRDYRNDIMRNHTSTHLLQAALREVLGEHVHQSGSYVGPDKLRFDFSHFQPMTPEEINRVEKIVNERVLSAVDVIPEDDVDIEEAKAKGAMAIFGEKYSDKVRVVKIPESIDQDEKYYSQELCGGTHVANTSHIGPFMITLETGIASGIRRIEAITGKLAIDKMLEDKLIIEKASKVYNRPTDEIVAAMEENSRKVIDQQKEIKKLKSEKFSGGSNSIGETENIGDITLHYHDFGEVEADEMSGWADTVKNSQKPEVSGSIGIINGKATFMASASKSADIHIGNLLKELLGEFGGRGGGKPTFARGTIPPDAEPDKVFAALKEKLAQK